MSLVTAAYSSDPNVERVTRADVLKRFLRNSGLGQYGTASGGTTTTIVHANRLIMPFAHSDSIEGWAYILKDAGGSGAAPEGESRAISSFAESTGTITVGTAFSASVASGDEYGVFSIIHPDEVIDHLDDLLKHHVYLPSWSILTPIPDGDMEQSGTSDWTASNATLSKATAEPVMNGTRWLQVTADAANGYAKSATLNVVPQDHYHVSALVRAGDSQAQVIVYDETNGAAITTLSTSSRTNVRLWDQFTTPEDCRQVTVRLVTVTSGESCYFDDVTLYGDNATEMPLPWWVRNVDQVHGIYRLRPLSIANTGNDHWDPSFRGFRDTRWDIRADEFGRGQLKVVARYGTVGYGPLYIKGTRNETAFSDNNSDIKHIDPRLLNAGLCYLAFNQIASYRNAGPLNLDWVREQRERWKAEWAMERRRQNHRLEQVENAESPDVLFWRTDPYSSTSQPRERLVQ